MIGTWHRVISSERISEVRNSARGPGYEEIRWRCELDCGHPSRPHIATVTVQYADAEGDSTVAPHLPPRKAQCPNGCPGTITVGTDPLDMVLWGIAGGIVLLGVILVLLGL